MNLPEVGRDRWARRGQNGRPGGPALPGSWPVSRSVRNKGLPMNPPTANVSRPSSASVFNFNFFAQSGPEFRQSG